MDHLDQQILQCLMLDGRVPMRRLADAVGVSEQTAARRYRALHEAGVLRVLVRPAAASDTSRLWLLRLQCRPDASARLGDRLAARDDVGWVALVSGGAELMCTTSLPAGSACGTGVLPRLSNTAAVLSFSAYSVLRSYSGGPAEWSGFDEPLTAEAQRHLLNGREPTRRVARGEVLPDDRELLHELALDGRATQAALARALDWPMSRVAGRLQALLDTGAVDVDVDYLLEPFGFTTSAYLFLQVAPDRIVAVCEALSAHRFTSWVAAISGAANVMAAVTCRSGNDLFEYVTGQVGALGGVIHVETLPVLTRLKQADTRVTRGRLER
ncbi:Lrp/AsnC family transcriptional regulator [Amycolatopsis sp. NPDC098790]|uniref:Lrp/AsnC family transcriptional regulator n=1 Tax=Amycolatopsis sp. NPDC098790 TaxID=3363939 RepID=UPI00382F5E81